MVGPKTNINGCHCRQEKIVSMLKCDTNQIAKEIDEKHFKKSLSV